MTVGSEVQRPRRTGVAGLEFDGQEKFFDSASIGKESKGAQAARGSSAENGGKEGNGGNHEGERNAWAEAVRAVKIEFASLLGVGEASTAVFYNTTAAAQRILMYLDRRMDAPAGTLLLSDAEYPGIIAAAHEYWRGGINVVAVNELLWKGDWQRAEDVLLRACLLGRPSVIYLSHVTRTTGHLLSTQTAALIREVLPRSIIVMDGAQAVGNVELDRKLLSTVDFYITSGHKWLGGHPALGLVYSAEAKILADQAQAYSSRSGSAGTGSLGVLRSTAAAIRDFVTSGSPGETARIRMQSIAKHNRDRAREFVDAVRRAGWKLRPLWSEEAGTGIVTLADEGTNLKEERFERLGFSVSRVLAEPYVGVEVIRAAGPRYWVRENGRGDGLVVEPLDLESFSTNDPARGGWRFSLHYFHESKHVADLIAVLGGIA